MEWPLTEREGRGSKKMKNAVYESKKTTHRKLAKKERVLIHNAAKLAYYTVHGNEEAADALNVLMYCHPSHTKAGIMIAAYLGAIELEEARLLCGLD